LYSTNLSTNFRNMPFFSTSPNLSSVSMRVLLYVEVKFIVHSDKVTDSDFGGYV